MTFAVETLSLALSPTLTPTLALTPTPIPYLTRHDLCGRGHPRAQREDLATLLRAAGELVSE